MLWKVEDCWETKDEILSGNKCPYVEEKKIVIGIDIYRKIKTLVDNFSTEWLGYLKFKEENGKIVVTDLLIPKQRVSGAHVKVIESELGVGCGVIHCHPWGGKPSFSGIDEHSINSNHPFSILVNKDMEMVAVALVKTPCGKLFKVDAKIELTIGEDKKFIEKIKDKIEEEPIVVVQKATYSDEISELCYYCRFFDRMEGKCTHPFVKKPSDDCPYFMW